MKPTQSTCGTGNFPRSTDRNEVTNPAVGERAAN